MSLYLLKYITDQGRYEILKPGESVTVGGVVIGDGTDIVTVSGVNSLAVVIAEVSGAVSLEDDALRTLIETVSGAGSARDDAQDATIAAVSGASSLRDDAQDLTLQSVSGSLLARIDSVSGASSLRDDAQDAVTQGVSGNLQSQINAITADRAKEERFEAVSGQQIFTLSTIQFDPDGAVRDAQVFKNGVKMFQSINGSISGAVSGGDFIKTETQVQFLYPLKDGDRVIVRDERTGGGGGSLDLENISVDIAPDSIGSRSVGKAIRPFSSVYLWDYVCGVSWRLEIVSGVIQAEQV